MVSQLFRFLFSARLALLTSRMARAVSSPEASSTGREGATFSGTYIRTLSTVRTVRYAQRRGRGTLASHTTCRHRLSCCDVATIDCKRMHSCNVSTQFCTYSTYVVDCWGVLSLLVHAPPSTVLIVLIYLRYWLLSTYGTGTLYTTRAVYV